MSNLTDKIDWAIDTFNKEIESGKDAKECLGLLGYVKKIYPNNRFPAWARNRLSTEAYEAAEEGGFRF
jgi:hypothetical protein